ncbi:MAG TPA: penicillin-binding protein [Patescibacteria group bacterium]|nr:penicillin-binding protein [Patescibacteria group bacterium]
MYKPQRRIKLFKRRRKPFQVNNAFVFTPDVTDEAQKDFEEAKEEFDPEKRRRRWKIAIYIVAAFFLFCASVFAWFSKDLPNPYKINNRTVAQSSKILDRNGKLLYEIYGEEKRTLITPAQIPDNVKKATIAIEDQEFYKHSGFDLKGIVRAVFRDIASRDLQQGGSTITQQFVKKALLTSDKSITRKIKELILSIEIEKIYSKDEILTMYLNEIPYGNNAYGIEAASKTYFNKEAKDLTLAEAATLAAIPQAPTYYNPYGSNTDLLMKRKDTVLDKMIEIQLVTDELANQAKKEDIKFVQKDQGILAPHFVMYVKEQLAEKYGEDRLNLGGLTVTTSLDLDKQKIAEDILTKDIPNLKSGGASNAALVSMDPKTGEILAMAGSVNYFDTENDGNVNVALRPRQPGSSLKPIIYTLAFTQGYSPSTMLMDVETDFGQGYKPKNYDGAFRGPVSIRKSLGNSLNIPAVKTLALVGIKNATDFAQKLGIASLNDPNRYGLSLVLGGGEVKLLESTTAYSVLANQGIKHDPHPILKIVDSNGKTLEEYKPDEDKGERVVDENATYLTTNILSDDSARAEVFGMGGILTLPGRPVAAKTGTTDEYRDAWTLGYTPSVVTGVWVGNNDNKEMSHASGAMIAAPIWNSYMKAVLANTPVEKFAVPSDIIHANVDALTGLLPIDTGAVSGDSATKLPTKDEVFWKKFPVKNTDNVHKFVKVVKGEDKLAAKDCPEGMTENKAYLEFHSEMPDNPNWENPVVAWAKAAGYNNMPSEEMSCKDIEKENQPTITILSPKNNDSISNGLLDVSIAFKAPKDIDNVKYFINEEEIAEKKSGVAGNSFNLEAFALPTNLKGKVKIKVQLTDKIGLTAFNEIELNILSSLTLPSPANP